MEFTFESRSRKFSTQRRARAAAVLALIAGLVSCPVPALAQKAAPSASVTATAVASQRIETEIITVRGSGATPSQITRHPGVFFLAIANRTQDPNADISLQSVSLGSAVSGVIDSAAFRWRRVSAGLANLPVGEYQLIYVPTKRVLCHISIQ